MRLGVELDTHSDDPEAIARAYVDAGYSAAVCPPVSLDHPARYYDNAELLHECFSIWNKEEK
jgi:hypothetical protein